MNPPTFRSVPMLEAVDRRAIEDAERPHIGKRVIALRLYDGALTPSQIADRLNIPHAVVSGWVREVRERKEK